MSYTSTRPVAWIMMALLLASCAPGDDTPLEVTAAGHVPTGEQAPLELALKPRRHGDLVRHYHHPGAVYDIHVTPLRVTTIVFQPDEQVVTIGAGDTERFSVELTGTDGRDALLVKPVARNIQTNVSVVTDRRVYVLRLIADRDTNYVVAFEPYIRENLEPLPRNNVWPPRPLARAQGASAGGQGS